MIKKNEYINLLGFYNYRNFSKKTYLELKPVTILTGPNSSGKSSVIKALKLLKQNTPKHKNGGLSTELSFIQDEFGHQLGGFKRILSRSNPNIEELTFSLPIKLETLGDDYCVDLTFGISQLDSKLPTLKSYTVFHFSENRKRNLFSIKGDNDLFDTMTVDFLHFKDCLENIFLPIFDTSKHFKYLNDIETIMKESKILHLPGKDILDLFSTRLKEYDKEKPLLPYYKIFDEKVDFSYSDEPDETEINDYYENFEIIKEHYNSEIEIFRNKGNLKHTDALTSYFKQKEENLYKHINKEKLELPIDFSSGDRNLLWWKGLTYSRLYPEGSSRSDTAHSIREFDKYFTVLMYLFDSSTIKNIDEHSNAFIFFSYIKYIVMQSIEQVRNQITNIYFYDSNRIEQAMFYNVSNARIAYNLLNDYKKIEKKFNHQAIEEQLRKLNICESFEINTTDYGIYQVHLLTAKKEKIPLAEFGFGITKLFFLLIAIQSYPVLFIEEPESNLHPDLQSKLANVIIDSLSKDKQFIIESHSEYMIRKIQYLIATNKVDKDSILINYFNSPNDRKKLGIIRKISFRKDGSLNGEFGTGFFDEVANIIEEIYKYTFYN